LVSLEKGDQDRSIYNVLSALFVFVVSLGVYLTTVAPTIAFWDCGEYIGAAHSLGIPHPPGNPLFVLMMRVASIFLPFFEDVGYRMNVTVALASALTAMVLYLVIVEAGKLFIGTPDTVQKKVALSVGGMVGGLFAAFGYTFWFSAVETSVYNLSMLNIAICTLLMLRWARSQKPDRDKLLILVAFLGFLGIGLHMYTMIIFPPAFLFMMLWDEKKRWDWRLWFTGITMAAVIYSLSAFLWLGPITLIIALVMSTVRKTEIRIACFSGLALVVAIMLQSFIPEHLNLITWFFTELSPLLRIIAVMVAVATIVAAFEKNDRRAEWRLCFFFALLAIIGYSVHLFIPIRSALEPMINENHPSTLQALVGFLERKQYGSESMITRMFWRRGDWGNQFGIEEHMGYGGFHITQFFRFAVEDTGQSMFRHGFPKGMAQLAFYLVPTVFMLYGWLYMWKKNRAAAVFLVSLTLLTTIGMVFYMNFADGNRAERYDYLMWEQNGRPGPQPTVHREVRVRDYFFTAGFMYFGMWIGMAACCLLHALFSSKSSNQRIIAPAIAVLLAVSPVIPAVTNYNLSTRTGDWVAYDYAYNLLNSCEPNGIIFTNGDNDTFPLWALQEAYGIRNDVRVVNLSLVNTDWYIKQLRKLEPRVPISFTEEEIDRLQPQLNPFPEPRQHTLRNANLTFVMPGIQHHRVLRVQDRMVLNIVDATAWSKPIYFAMTVSEDNLMGLAPFLRAEGLVYRLMPERVSADNHYNLDRTIELVDSIYSMRGIGRARHNDTSRRLLTNYLQIAFDLRRPMDRLRRDNDPRYEEYLEATLRFMDRCVDLMPWDWRPRAIRHEFLMDNNRVEEAKAAIERAIAEDPANVSHYLPLREQAVRAVERIRTEGSGPTSDNPTPEQLLERLQEALENAEQLEEGGES
jgi:hypothetical protein